MKHFLPALALALSASAVLAGQVCTIDPPRPAASSVGFYVVGSKLYDPTGEPFISRGVNHVHWDQAGGFTGVPLSGANAERMLIDFTKPAASNLLIVQKAINTGLVAIPSNWKGTCKSDPAILTAIVDTWVSQASTWTQLNTTALINIANEWGPTSVIQQQVSPWAKLPNYTWRDNYITAVQRMRDAGYLGTLVIDAGNCGQDALTVTRDGPAVIAADPLHNILFDVHVYGGFHLATATDTSASWQQDYVKAFAAMKASGLPIIIGEFGPGRGVGPSPTLLTPDRLVADAEANGWGWLAWAWDDNNLTGCGGNDNWFSLTTKCGIYTGVDDTELTTFGKTIVPILKATAKKANFK